MRQLFLQKQFYKLAMSCPALSNVVSKANGFLVGWDDNYLEKIHFGT